MPLNHTGLDQPSPSEPPRPQSRGDRGKQASPSWRRPLRRASAILSIAAAAAVAVAGCGSSSKSSTSSSAPASSAPASTTPATSTSATSTSATSTAAASGGGGKTINVGNITSVAGLGGTFTGFQAGVKAFFEYYNAHGGINGYKVNLTAIDDAGDPGKNATAARTLVEQNHVVAIVGEASLGDAASQKYLQAQGIPVVGGWATSSAWLKPSTNMFVSLAGPQAPYCPLWSSDAAKALGTKSMGFIAQAFPDAVQDAKCREAAAKYNGIATKGSIGQASLTAVDYRPQVQAAMGSGASSIYFSTGADGQLKGIAAGQQLGFKGLYIVTQPSGLTPGLKSLGSALNNRVITSAFSLLPNDPASYSPELAKYEAGIKQYEPSEQNEITSVSGWAAAKMFADALTAAGPSGAAITAWLSKQTAYGFGGLQGPMNYTQGSRPNPCTTRLALVNDAFVRSSVAAKPPGFNCSPLINPATGVAYPNSQ
jgi:branched-chain amino acid transport system substrate-binding protein